MGTRRNLFRRGVRKLRREWRRLTSREDAPRRTGVSVEHVICIAGISYCGSSVMNLVLDGHPQIYGGGELHKLFHPKKTPRCSVCQYDCELWTPAALENVPKEGLYEYLAQVFGAPVIVNSAKTIDHFAEIHPLNADVPSTYVLLVKHPIRHLTSYVNNKWLVNEGLIEAVDSRGLAEEERAKMVEYVQQKAQGMLGSYDRIQAILTELMGEGEYLVVRYEDFVEKPEQTLEPILAPVGLTFEPAMVGYTSLEHHPIGGNRGPHYQISKELSVSRFTSYRKDYYEKNPGLAMDNKHIDTFTDDELDVIVATPGYRELCERLGYGPDDFPRESDR